MTFSIIHPSIRSHKWREIYDAWLKAVRISTSDVEYLLAVDQKWGFGQNRDVHDWELQRALQPKANRNKLIWTTGPYVESVNQAAKQATGDVLIVIADDIWPADGWDEVFWKAAQSFTLDGMPESGILIANSKIEVLLTGEFVIWVNSGDRHIGTRADIMAMPVMSRSRFERLGYLYYPLYESMYADNDLAEHCQKDAAEGRCSLIVLDEPVFPHKHPANDPSVPIDAQYQKQNRPEAYALGLRVFEARRASGFVDVTVPLYQRPKIAVCIAGNSFSMPWVIRWTKLLELGFTRHNWNLHFSAGITNVYHMRIGMAREVLADQPVDYVLWIDDDQLVEQEHVLQLLADLEENPDIGMVAGWTVCAVDSYESELQISCGFEEGKLAVPADLEGPDDLKDVLYTGFPLVLMRYSLLAELGPEGFYPILKREPVLPMGEDVSFCRRARYIEKRICVDRRVGPLPHLKLRNIAVVKP